MTILVRCVGACALLAALGALSACGRDCGTGTVEKDGQCVSASFVCGAGTVLADGVCVATVTGCGDGTQVDGSQCILTGDGADLCGAGTVFDAGTQRCVTAVADHCGINTIAVGATCVVAARLQLIHSLELAGMTSADVYIDGVLAVNDLAYRTATPFLAVPSGTRSVVVAPASTGGAVGDALPSGFTPTMTASVAASPLTDTVIVLAGGGGFSVATRVVPRSVDADVVAVVFAHASPDAPSPMDIEDEGVNESSEVDDTTIVDNLPFAQASAVVPLSAARYLMEFTNAAGAPGGTRFRVNLGSFGGGAITVLASGFNTPPNGAAAFALLAFDAVGGAPVTFPAD